MVYADRYVSGFERQIDRSYPPDAAERVLYYRHEDIHEQHSGGDYRIGQDRRCRGLPYFRPADSAFVQACTCHHRFVYRFGLLE
ncbi:hypothetical protein D3C84_1135850 [compost metagenome]